MDGGRLVGYHYYYQHINMCWYYCEGPVLLLVENIDQQLEPPSLLVHVGLGHPQHLHQDLEGKPERNTQTDRLTGLTSSLVSSRAMSEARRGLSLM